MRPGADQKDRGFGKPRASVVTIMAMAGLRREDFISLSAKNIAEKLEQVGLPKTLTGTLRGKDSAYFFFGSLKSVV